MATLHLMVGLPCSGKTTLALTLEKTCSALRLTLDDWHIRLFGQDAAAAEHTARHMIIEALQWEVASRALVLGTNVILDFGFWAREEREDYRARARQLGASSEIHFLDVPNEELLRRLAQRNAQLSSLALHGTEEPLPLSNVQRSPLSFYIAEEMMLSWLTFFQKPTRDELDRRD